MMMIALLGEEVRTSSRKRSRVRMRRVMLFLIWIQMSVKMIRTRIWELSMMSIVVKMATGERKL